jgi:hypothetical protein
MEVKSKGIELLLTLEEAVALTKLLDSMSRMSMMEQGNVDLEEANLLQVMYGTLSAFVPNEQAA